MKRSSTVSGPEPDRSAVVTGNARILLIAGAAIFGLSFLPNIALGVALWGDFLELAGTALLVVGANLIVLRLTSRPYIVRLFLMGSMFLILARFFDYTEELRVLRSVPLLGGEGYAHEFAQHVSEGIGYICLLITMLLVMYELALLNEQTESEKRRISELLQASQYLSRLVDLSPDTVFAVNSQGRIQVWNAGAQRMFGYGEADALRLAFRELLVEGLEGAGEDLVAWIDQHGPQDEVEVVGRRQDGTRFPAAASFAPVTDDGGKALGACVIVRSTEARKRIERELLDSRDLLARALQSADVGLFIVDRSGTLLEFNQRMESITGIPREDLANRPIAQVLAQLLLNPEPVRKTIEDRVLGQGQHAEFRNLVLSRADGQARVCNGALAPVLSADGTIVAVAGVVVDVTEREALHAKLLEVQKMDSIGRLAGGIAHDFNNIMAGVLGYATLVRQELGPDSPHQRRMQAIEESALRASELTNQLLTFARAGVRNVERVSLNEVGAETVNLLSHTLDPNIRVRLDGEPGLDLVEVDRAQVRQVLMNLCLNSRDAMGESGEIRITTRNTNVDDLLGESLQVLGRGPFVCLSVEDTGCGMPADVIRRMFEPFFSTKQPGRANGLGLSVVYGIIQAHGGGLKVESEVGRGTRIDIYLPSAGRVEQGQAGMSAEVEPEEGHDGLILVVDDEKLIRTLLQDILAMGGHNVIEATTGEEALEVYRERASEISLVILDIVMPGMGGARTLEMLTEINPDIKCIVSSGYGSETLDSGLLNRKNTRFVAKPFQTSSVINTVQELLEA
ncbi:MAG: PAS domain S-box protein [Candidatus Hydrogenedentes bacterium]|nr:PAS domain S-box protein [Candidatus Hydrogenedentota bacterium]